RQSDTEADLDLAQASPNPPSKPVRTTVGRYKRSEWLTGYLFILPATVLILVFGLFPIGYALYMSVFRWRIRQGAFIGLDNYADVLGNGWGALAFFGGLLLIMVAHWLWTDAFRRSGGTYLRVAGAAVLLASGVFVALGWSLMREAGDDRFLSGLVRTVYYGFGSVPVQIFLALGLASLLFQKIRGQELFRMVYFLPYVTPAVAGAAIFRSLFSPRDRKSTRLH